MAQDPEDFADSPQPPAYGEHDALSDVLQAIHLQGGEVRRRSSPRERHPAGARVLHLVEEGGISVEVAGEDTVELGTGDLVLLARGDAHIVRATPHTTWVTGEFVVETVVAAPLLGVLPAAIVIRGDARSAAWLLPIRELLVFEVTNSAPGTRVMVSRALDLLFIWSLRSWASAGDVRNAGWLTAALDPVLAPVLTAIHRDPGRDWPVDELARLTSLSRSAFATRFAESVGETPGSYVLRCRLGHAAHLLRGTADPVGRIAARVGYISEAAFSRAFSRAYGSSPRAWRGGTGSASFEGTTE
ncbi:MULTISPECIES: AraC family transcriptional regulator [unclassified Amycolatopsis]|uniref:AraC family transcriptional regulator n=1 Tax=unclassified Amycolatopsis TaxID=2618356 RepID=UPI001C6950A7|nr:AraC family transcriptional regulator [Amycolatopsis sp. DSM 110486]QYN21503.1 AraC family transcriptional regulator [Amycolatopsis sp. DSM 110486]